jgi:6-phosphogluconolactonase (cycloisomerase 2 family)
MDAETGKLTPKGEVPVSGDPWALTISTDRKDLCAGNREVAEISSFPIGPDTGGLRQIGLIRPEAAPTYLSTDRKGWYCCPPIFIAAIQRYILSGKTER